MLLMNAWTWEIFEDAINSVPCVVTNPGPLRAPIKNLSIRRNEERELILETTGPGETRGSWKPYPAGTVRRSDETMEFETPGFTAVARGVTPRSWRRTQNVQAETGITTEEASLYSLVLTFQSPADPQYTIDWIQNFDAQEFLWFGNIADKSERKATRTLGKGSEAITLKSMSTAHSGRNQCVHPVIGGKELFLGAARDDLPKTIMKPGFILYKGKPDEHEREKIRGCVSFALGTCFIFLGCTVLDTECNPISMTAVAADTFNDRLFKVAVQPPAPLEKRYKREANPVALGRLANALYAKYDELQFSHLGWAYWHAVCAPVHMAAAHFGAAIEALQDAYVKAHPSDFQTKLVRERKDWQELQGKLLGIVEAAGLPADVQTILVNKVGGLNSVPASKLSEQVFDHLGIRLGELENKAWRQRHIAAHGAFSEDDPVATIKETKLLKIILHRLLLKITGGSDLYRDYYTLDFPNRRLEEPIS
jgi:hypothetical protein